MKEKTNDFKKSELEMLFSGKFTENGDKSFSTTGNSLTDILFMTEYYGKHLEEVRIGDSDYEKLFSMFIRDPRFGMGRRDLGRNLMHQAGVTPENIVRAGRYDDLWNLVGSASLPGIGNHVLECIEYLRTRIEGGDELAKKWAPRYSSKNIAVARMLAKMWLMNKQTYGKFVKSDTTERKLTEKRTDDIIFEQVPSLAGIKYAKRFKEGEDTAARYAEYCQKVKRGEAKLNVSVASVYDILRNGKKIDQDMYFDKMPKISGSWIPVLDTSGSMFDTNDSIVKAMSVAHYLAKCSTYCKDKVVSFSSRPELISLDPNFKTKDYETYGHWDRYYMDKISDMCDGDKYRYGREILSMYTGDCSNTDLGAVMNILGGLKEEFPEYIVILSDMEFDGGSKCEKDMLMTKWRENGIWTKIVWWNFNSRAQTVPETDKYGNIFMSGYNPLLINYLENGFDSSAYLDHLLEEYKKNVGLK